MPKRQKMDHLISLWSKEDKRNEPRDGDSDRGRSLPDVTLESGSSTAEENSASQTVKNQETMAAVGIGIYIKIREFLFVFSIFLLTS